MKLIRKILLIKDSDPDRFVLVAAWLLAPLRQLIDGARFAALTLPDFLGRRETVGDSRQNKVYFYVYYMNLQIVWKK